LVPDPTLLGGLVAIEPTNDGPWAKTDVSITAFDEYGNEIGDGLSTYVHVMSSSLDGYALFEYTFPGGIFEVPLGTVKVLVSLCGDGRYSFRAISPEAELAEPGVWPSLFVGLDIRRPSGELCYSKLLFVDANLWGTAIRFAAQAKKSRSGWVKLHFNDQYSNVIGEGVDTEPSFTNDPLYFKYSGDTLNIPAGTTSVSIEICSGDFEYVFSALP
jgi:hypothetical protein